MARARRTRSQAVLDWIEPVLAEPGGCRPRMGYETKLDGDRAAMPIASDGRTVLSSRPNSGTPQRRCTGCTPAQK